MLKRSRSRSAFTICCHRLCTSKFEHKSAKFKAERLSRLKKTKQLINDRSKWNNRMEFLLSCIGFTVGLGNVWRFPIKVYYGGGGAFLIPYIFLCFTIGTPFLLLEMGLGQFCGHSVVKAFKFVPVLFGIGWSMFILNIFILIYYGVIMAWSYFYLFGSLNPKMPWTMCNHNFNTVKCLPSTTNYEALNKSITHVSSTSEYWDYYVTGFVKYPSREIYTMNENPGRPTWQLTMCLLLVWAVAACAIMFGIKVSGKIVYFSVFFPYASLLILILIGCRLPGAFDGVTYYLSPNWGKMMDPIILRGAVEQLLFSCSIAMGGLLTFSSYNDFRDNIYRDAIIVMVVDFVTSVIAGLAVFQILGYMSHRNGVAIEKVISSGSGLFFITYPEGLAKLPLSNLWTFIFMLLAISLGMDSQYAMLETIISSLVDVFPSIKKTKIRKVVCVWIICLLFFFSGILLCAPGGQYYIEIIDLRVSSFGVPILAFLEASAIGLIYGVKQFRYDFRIMLGFSLSWFWFITMGFICPFIIALILITSVIKFDRLKIIEKYFPIWGEILSGILLLILLSPLLICAIYTIISYWIKYPELKGKEFLRKLFTAPIYWGPLYLKHWLLSSFYREKFQVNKDDPIFLKYISDFEDIHHVTALVLPGNPALRFVSTEESDEESTTDS